jgi:quercetin dioxygenase-like cupin family protein
MEITKAAAIPAKRGQADYFSGEVWQEVLAPGGADGVWVLRVSFPPKARTAWHTHPAGQVLLVTSGRGYAQKWGEPRCDIVAGDVVRFEAGEKHWHGAAADSPMQHIAIQTAQGASTADWLELVSDRQYEEA